jgi:hypothetical protein
LSAVCNCQGVEIGTYATEVEVVPPRSLGLRRNTPERELVETVCIDACLVAEVASLWRRGIRTTGCCCGHNQREGFIGVEPEFIPSMKALGYMVQPNPHDATREDSFTPKHFTPADRKEGSDG